MREIKYCYKRELKIGNNKGVLSINKHNISLQSKYRLYYSKTYDRIRMNYDYEENTWILFHSIERVK